MEICSQIRVLRRMLWIAAVLSVLGLNAGAGFAADAAPPPKELEVVVMDVGQGDGIFLRTPGGKNILIDVGPDARRGVLPYLRSRKIKQIDVLVLSHPHADHIGGALDVMDYAEVLEVLDSGKDHVTPAYPRILRAVEDRGIRYRQPRSGEKLNWDPALDVKVFHPDRADYENINDNSIILRVAYGKISFLFTGDAEEDAEAVALGKFRSELKSDILKVGHHGSRTSSKPEFLDAVRPKFALISCGYGNSFRHPRQETLDNLESVGAKIMRTDQDGYLIFQTDGRQIQWATSPIPFPILKIMSGLPENLAGPDWSGRGRARSTEVTLSAEAGENLWTDIATAPRWTRPIPVAEKWFCETSLTPADGYRTEGGLMIYGDEKNFILFGIQEKRLTAITVVKDGRVKLGPELVSYLPTRIGFRRTAKTLYAVAYDNQKNVWRVLWKLSAPNLPRLSETAEVGLYVKSWGKDPSTATFNHFKLNSSTTVSSAEASER